MSNEEVLNNIELHTDGTLYEQIESLWVAQEDLIVEYNCMFWNGLHKYMPDEMLAELEMDGIYQTSPRYWNYNMHLIYERVTTLSKVNQYLETYLFQHKPKRLSDTIE